MCAHSKNKKEKVLLGLSGGVDSAAAAVLLQKDYEVLAVTFVMYGRTDTVKQQIEKTRATANALGIPLIVLDVAGRFDACVRQPFLNAWREGKTPNPCVLCNPAVKFRVLLEQADANGCPWIATGHYARVICVDRADVPGCLPAAGTSDGSSAAASGGEMSASCLAEGRRDEAVRADDRRVYLACARDPKRDQSYFLNRLPASVLQRVLFPLGEFSKDDARAAAASAGLAAAGELDSQDICFLEHRTLREYLALQPFVDDPGPFLDVDGRVIGRHRGIWNFTVGQRRRLGQAFGSRKTVLEINPVRKAIILGDESDAFMTGLELGDCVFSNSVPEIFDAEVKLRSQGARLPARIERRPAGGAFVTFHAPVRLSSPGQSVVFHCGDYVLGGGIVRCLQRLRQLP